MKGQRLEICGEPKFTLVSRAFAKVYGMYTAAACTFLKLIAYWIYELK